MDGEEGRLTSLRRASTCGLRAGALTQYIVLRGSMNSERPPESASSTPTGPGGSEGLREGPGYFLFESRRPFEHELTFHVPVHLLRTTC